MLLLPEIPTSVFSLFGIFTLYPADVLSIWAGEWEVRTKFILPAWYCRCHQGGNDQNQQHLQGMANVKWLLTWIESVGTLILRRVTIFITLSTSAGSCGILWFFLSDLFLYFNISLRRFFHLSNFYWSNSIFRHRSFIFLKIFSITVTFKILLSISIEVCVAIKLDSFCTKYTRSWKMLVFHVVFIIRNQLNE